MVTQRKVANLMALAVLSVLAQRPMHRYEMASFMKARGKDRDMDVKWGSLYTVVQNMERHGLVEAIGTSRQGARPERTVYRITDAGRAEMRAWTRELLAEPEPERPRFAAGLSVMAGLSPAETAGLLRARLVALGERIAAQRAGLAEHGREIPRLFLVEDEYRLTLLEAEETWVRALIAELEAGTFPDLAQWRTWHETGALTPEMAELAERGSLPDTS